ncbi:type IA DNA topoisomerase [Paenibacillus sp. FSL K6-1230]|uniref:type IA DNA topoisomerase n=1 Tax=Paenibacillus sp. FSL K6-1230 TaxID=2921603 RepID=UPI0030F759C2
MKTLVIAEKPDMGRTIAAVIEPRAKNNRSYLEGEQYIITWAIGHLLGLAEPDAYDPKYKKWSIQDLPIIPERFQIVPNPRTKDQLKIIGELAGRCNHVVNACDAGREGQYIFALIQQQLRLKQPVKRLWISDLTAQSISAGFANLKDAADFEFLTQAARARSEADWLIGMNASRAFTTRHNALLSVGRVQTPVLALIHDREKEIEAFQSQTFYDVIAYFKQEDTIYKGMWQGDRLTEVEKAEAIAAQTRGKPGIVESYDVKETKEYPFKLYDLTLLQREANAKYGYSAKKTLDLAQALYEKHKIISYPRTNSNYVTEQNIEGMHKALQMLKGTSYAKWADQADSKRVHKNNKAVCNPARVEDHHAILPTLKRPGTLSKEEEHIYDLIVRRFLSHFYPPAEYRVHSIITKVEEHRYKTGVKELISLGWKVLQEAAGQGSSKPSKRGKKDDAEDKEEEELLDGPFHLKPEQGVLCTEAEAKEKATKPPKSYTEGTLLKAMESAGKQMEDEELREVMKDAGLGTPATRAATIERLKQVGYIDMKGKRILITEKGKTAIELIRGAGVDLLASPEMTGQWERRLHQISRGEAQQEKFMDNVKKFTISVIEKVRQQKPAAATAFGEDSRGRKGGRTVNAKGSARTTRNVGGRGSSAGSVSSRATGEFSGGQAQKSADPTTRKLLGTCPRPGCGGAIIEGRKGYGCTHFKQGCSFVIWKEYAGKSVSETMLGSLLSKGQTQKLTFKTRSGESVKGRILLEDASTGKLGVRKEE